MFKSVNEVPVSIEFNGWMFNSMINSQMMSNIKKTIEKWNVLMIYTSLLVFNEW